MLRNVELVRSLHSGISIALMFKDFYADFFDERFDEYVCFGNSVKARRAVTTTITNRESSWGKITTIYNECSARERIYIPLEVGDKREGLSIDTAMSLAKSITDREKWLLITSGCVDNVHPQLSDFESIWARTCNSFSGISVGGSFWVPYILHSSVKEIRIGEFMLFGTVPYCEGILHGERAVTLECDIIAKYSDRRHLLIDAGKQNFNSVCSTLLTSGLSVVHSSCEYTTLEYDRDIFSVGDKVFFAPDYYSLITLRYADRKYIG